MTVVWNKPKLSVDCIRGEFYLEVDVAAIPGLLYKFYLILEITNCDTEDPQPETQAKNGV